MVSSIEMLSETLRSNKMSVTTARTTVFTILENSGPISMGELCRVLNGTVDRASIYRTIGVFEQLNIVQRLTFGWKYKLELSNEFQDHHHHMSCHQCGELISFHENDELERAITEIANEHAFTLTGHQVELQGICRNCHTKT